MTGQRQGLSAEERLRDLFRRIGFGDGVTEPMADNDTVVEFIDAAVMDQGEHRECPIVCELCGERLADKPCEHCGGCGANVALSTAALAYAECERCAGAGKVHEGCKELTYAELAARTDALAGQVAAVEALCAEWESTVYKLAAGYPLTTDEFVTFWFKGPLRAALDAPGDALVRRDTRVKAEAWDECLQALAWCLDNGPADAALAYLVEHNPHRAERLLGDEGGGS